MADGDPGPPDPVPRGDAIGLRLALAFAGVALAAIALLAGLTAAFAAADVSSLASRQRMELTKAIAAAAGAAWAHNDDWKSANIAPALNLAGQVGADAEIRDQDGRLVAVSRGFAAGAASPQLSSAVMVHGKPVGTAVVRFTGSGLAAANHTLQTALLRAIAGAAGLAAVLALLTGLGIARRITRPVEKLIAATRAMARGDRAARVGQIPAPGELGELATAFDQMANALDRQEQLRRALVADVAHELRTPIAVLQAGHEALLDGVAEPTPAQLSSLRDEVLRLARMVGDLQTLAAAEAAALHLNLSRCDLADIAATAADSLAGRFETTGITLERRLAPAEVLADPGRLHQVVTNLLTNALKFTPAGGRVTLRTGLAGRGAELEVTDTGVGIPADELPHIFERFWRGQGAARVSGSGIGLSVAAELARAHGGDLAARSEPGHGTTMTLTLPTA
ncbi:MAG TPA: ATP-binding protein [Streptosporangiaceae bacterium]|nr:ATP-binding protein [Streptosporangiaceae bacterium]